MILPTIAVAMAVYNVEEFVDEALASIAAQTHPPDEVIVVDDASSDGTAERVRQWSDRLPLTLIALDTNVGCGAARSVAVRAATADIIAPFDGDDVWFPIHLEVTAPLVTPTVIAGTQQLRWFGGPLEDAESVGHQMPPPAEQAATIIQKNFMFSGSLYWRSTLINQAGGPSGFRTGEDRDTWIRMIARAGCTVVPAPTATVAYRSRPDSLSADEGCLDGVIEILEQCVGDHRLKVPQRHIARTLRRLTARRTFLDGLELAEQNKTAAARRRLIAAAIQDRSLRGGTALAEQGSVTLRSMVALAHPSAAANRRRQRMHGSSPLPTTENAAA